LLKGQGIHIHQRVQRFHGTREREKRRGDIQEMERLAELRGKGNMLDLGNRGIKL